MIKQALTLTLVASSLAGCGSESTPTPKKVELTNPTGQQAVKTLVQQVKKTTEQDKATTIDVSSESFTATKIRPSTEVVQATLIGPSTESMPASLIAPSTESIPASTIGLSTETMQASLISPSTESISATAIQPSKVVPEQIDTYCVAVKDGEYFQVHSYNANAFQINELVNDKGYADITGIEYRRDSYGNALDFCQSYGVKTVDYPKNETGFNPLQFHFASGDTYDMDIVQSFYNNNDHTTYETTLNVVGYQDGGATASGEVNSVNVTDANGMPMSPVKKRVRQWHVAYEDYNGERNLNFIHHGNTTSGRNDAKADSSWCYLAYWEFYMPYTGVPGKTMYETIDTMYHTNQVTYSSIEIAYDFLSSEVN
ncbi:hypothetical protein [Vibrio ezurae]|uniref:Lipoprotein n=1 Tax=Vibrio ezurae NBRC 102218 TaxID=1219080 RepID=U3CC43_9VIBR|nr:hypothetical protein [Vibrio ezurae]GAD78874.1 hypothetical protein VEZ01S_07_00510 [Vibrio ezurae NBRC 102218]